MQYFNDIQDDLQPLREWPQWLQEIQLNPNRRNRDRFSLFHFLWANGLNPYIAAIWCSATDITQDGNEIVQSRRDKVLRHVRQMIEQAENGTLLAQPKAYYCLHRRFVVRE